MNKATFEIFRADTEAKVTPRFDSFPVEYGERTTVLDLLWEIRRYQDGSLAFRSSCRSAICGSCGMRVNGYAKLACQTRVMEVIETSPAYAATSSAASAPIITIEPLGNFPILKDLIVDLDPFWQLNEGVLPYLEPKSELTTVPEREQPMSKAEANRMNRLADCILCACCTASCNSYEVDKKFQGPAALAKTCRFSLDPRDKLGAERGMRETSPKGSYWCCYCNFCTEVCPKDVRPAEAISILKSRAFSLGIPNDTGARRSLTFYDTVRKSGKINEGTLPIRTKRTKSIGYLPLGLRLLRKGKLPSPFMRPIPRYWELRTIYDNRESLENPYAPPFVEGEASDGGR